MRQIVRSVRLLVLAVLTGSCTWPQHPPIATSAPDTADAPPQRSHFLTLAPPRPPTDVTALPGEFDPVTDVLVSWHSDAWSYLPIYATLVREASRRSRVVVLLAEPEEEAFIRFHLAAAGADMRAVELVYAPLDSVWIRDYGPLVVRTRTRRLRAIDMPYDRSDDDRIPGVLAARSGWAVSSPPIQMDGGHLQSDGTGRCIVSDDLIYLNGELGITEAEVRAALRDYLGCRQLVFVPAFVDEATGHVDLMLYVTGPGKVLVGKYRAWQDRENRYRLDDTAKILSLAGFEVTRIPMPSNERRQVFRSYTNALVVNDAVFVPVYHRDRRYERQALRAFRAAFPDRTIIPVEADEVMEMGGAIHCITMTVAAP